MFHQLLEHRWFMSQQQARDVPLAEAVTAYVNDILRHRRDEATVIAPPTEALTLPNLVLDESGDAELTDEDADVDWTKNV